MVFNCVVLVLVGWSRTVERNGGLEEDGMDYRASGDT